MLRFSKTLISRIISQLSGLKICKLSQTLKTNPEIKLLIIGPQQGEEDASLQFTRNFVVHHSSAILDTPCMEFRNLRSTIL